MILGYINKIDLKIDLLHPNCIELKYFSISIHCEIVVLSY